MVIGLAINKYLIIPYLVHQIIRLLLIIGCGIWVTFGIILYIDLMTGIGAGAVILLVLIVISFLWIIFWLAVKNAYVEIAEKDNLQNLKSANEQWGSGHLPGT